MKFATGQGYLNFGSRGRTTEVAVVLDDASLSLPNAQHLRFNRFEVKIDNDPTTNSAKPVEAHLVPSFKLSGEIFGINLPEGHDPPLGRTIGRLALSGTVLGTIPPGPPSRTLSQWQSDGGTIEINRLDLGWGPLTIRTNGTMALDSDLQPVAALTGSIAGYGETLDVLARARLIKPNVAQIGKFVLGTLARPSRTGRRPEIEVPVTLQKRWLFVGPLKLLQMPTIRWH